MIGFHKPVETQAQNALVEQLFKAWKALQQQSKGLKRQARRIKYLKEKLDLLEKVLSKKESNL